MEALLVYNPNAGQDEEDKVEQLKDALRESGYQPVYKGTNEEKDLDPILENAKGLVVSAGGDGTARAIITRILDREDVYFTPLPMGTANNLCHNLGIEGDPVDSLMRLRSPQKLEIDVGRLQAPWGEDYFIEGAGIGFFAEILASYEPEKGKSILRSLESLVEILSEGFSRQTVVHLPDLTLDDKYLIVEILNINAVGPYLEFAPDADPSDGLLDVVCIKESEQEGYLNYLKGIIAEDMDELDSVDHYQVKEIKIEWQGFPVHTDGVVHPPDFDFYSGEEGEKVRLGNIRPYPDLPHDAEIKISVMPGALKVWLPEKESLKRLRFLHQRTVEL